jgi:two-component system KDP operon response regulator KdpE
MVVDDNPEHVDLVRKILEDRGDEVEGYSDPFQALSAAIEHNPDVIVVDQIMPLLEGTSLIREMKKAGVKSKFIVLSGLVNAGSLPSFKSGIADKYLKKPLPNDTLFSEVHGVL